MPFLMWLLAGCLVGMGFRRVLFFARTASGTLVGKAYRHTALITGLMVYACMSLQICLAAAIGAANIHTVVPLHLCSMVGVLTLPMLLSKNQDLWEFCLYLGAPGAAMALLFPSMLETPWPGAMAAGFLGLHGLIFWAPALPFAIGMRPRPHGVWRVFLWGNLFLAFVAVFNYIFHTNYLFLRMPPKGTPLDWFFQKGPVAYLVFIEGAAALLLWAQSALYAWALQTTDKKKLKGI